MRHTKTTPGFPPLCWAPLALLTLLLCSCAAPIDPKYLANSGHIQPISYPPTLILGQWASMSVSPVQTTSDLLECKVYYDFQPEGLGQLRQANRNRATGASISLEANFRWTYNGYNEWAIFLPSSENYRVTDSDGMSMGKRGPITLYARYYDGELYVTPGNEVWVTADAEHVGDLAERLRSQPPIFRSDEHGWILRF